MGILLKPNTQANILMYFLPNDIIFTEIKLTNPKRNLYNLKQV